jgi:hypothetical protein
MFSSSSYSSPPWPWIWFAGEDATVVLNRNQRQSTSNLSQIRRCKNW